MKTLAKSRLRPLMHAFERRERELHRLVEEERRSIEMVVFVELFERTGDEADHASARTQAAVESAVIDHYVCELLDLAAARDRLENGTFGICIDCGERIDDRRLKANPTARRCIECQNKHERRPARLHH